MFHVKNIEENIDFILTFLPNDFVNWTLHSISNHFDSYKFWEEC